MRGMQEITRLLDELERWVKFDTFCLSRDEQDRAGLELEKIRKFFDELYRGK